MPFAGSWREPPAPGGVVVLALRHGRPGMGNCTLGPISVSNLVGGRRIAGNSPPPSRNTRFGLSAKMPRAPPYVHFSWPGSVARSFGHPSTTSYGPEMSCAPMAPGTALNEAGVAAVCASAAGFISRLPPAMPMTTPTASADTRVTVLLIAVLPVSTVRRTVQEHPCVFTDVADCECIVYTQAAEVLGWRGLVERFRGSNHIDVIRQPRSARDGLSRSPGVRRSTGGHPAVAGRCTSHVAVNPSRSRLTLGGWKIENMRCK